MGVQRRGGERRAFILLFSKLEIFFEEVKTLYTYIEKLVGGLLTRRSSQFCPDIFAAIQNATGVSVVVIGVY